MLTAHAPAGYALSKFAAKTGLIPERIAKPRTVIAVGVAASILPDLDLIYFYTVDARQHLHHSYWTHIPAFWLAICCAAAIACYALPYRRAIPLIALAGVNLLLHCFLDSIPTGILWLEPFSHRYIVFSRVPNVYPHTFLNFVLHWTFALEVVIWAAAFAAFAWGRRRRIPQRERMGQQVVPELDQA